jgi:hypothetical protein
MLFGRYMHLKMAKPIHNDKPISSSERILHKGYDCKGSFKNNLWS